MEWQRPSLQWCDHIRAFHKDSTEFKVTKVECSQSFSGKCEVITFDVPMGKVKDILDNLYTFLMLPAGYVKHKENIGKELHLMF